MRQSPVAGRVRSLTLAVLAATILPALSASVSRVEGWPAPRTIGASLPASPSAQAAAQAAVCSLSWKDRDTEIEEYMRTAPIDKIEDVPIGVTKPKRAVFTPGGAARRAAWKVLPPAYRNGFHESYKAEIAAYLFDRLIGLNRVPPVVERRIDRQTGALLLWVENTKGWDAKNPPSGPEPHWSHEISRMKLFDLIIANIDRNQGNLIYDADWHIFLIDHSRAFTDRKNLKNVAPVVRVDRELWNRMEALTLAQITPVLGAWLTTKEMEAIVARRDLMREEIAKLVKKNGEANTFF